jgi:hypothetical protein
MVRSLVGNGVFGGSWFGLFWSIFIKLHEFCKIELWLLKDLYFSNHAVVLEWEDFVALLLDSFANFFFNEGFDEVLESRLLNS